MSDYTPPAETVKSVWCEYLYHQSYGMKDPDRAAAEFDRFIAKVREDAKDEIRADFVLTRANIRKIKADAWDEGLQAGWEECQNPGPFVNDWWDSKSPNPYRVEGES